MNQSDKSVLAPAKASKYLQARHRLDYPETKRLAYLSRLATRGRKSDKIETRATSQPRLSVSS